MTPTCHSILVKVAESRKIFFNLDTSSVNFFFCQITVTELFKLKTSQFKNSKIFIIDFTLSLKLNENQNK